MFKLPDDARAGRLSGPVWNRCGGCDRLFPAAPDQKRCRDCSPAAPLAGRCQAAHPDDRSPCDGPADAVRVVDRVGDARYGCVRHAVVVLASVEGARVYPARVEAAAVEAFEQAQPLEPFGFDPAPPWQLPNAPGGGER